MFSGWKLTNDMNTLIQLKDGQFTFDFLAKTVKLNDEPYDGNFHMLFEISDWFDKDLIENKIERASIYRATLMVAFTATVIDGKPKSKTKKIIEINLKMKSSILTDEKEYLTEKEKAMEYHYIDKK